MWKKISHQCKNKRITTRLWMVGHYWVDTYMLWDKSLPLPTFQIKHLGISSSKIGPLFGTLFLPLRWGSQFGVHWSYITISKYKTFCVPCHILLSKLWRGPHRDIKYSDRYVWVVCEKLWPLFWEIKLMFKNRTSLARTCLGK